MLTINGKPTTEGPREEFFASEDPLTGLPIEEPTQLELKPKPKKPGTFTKRAKALIDRHKGGKKP